MARCGLKIDLQTLWDQTLGPANCFKETMERLHTHLLSQNVLLADESHWPVLGGPGRATKNWFTWALVADRAVLYKIMDSRSNEAASALLRDYRGVLLTDGYVVYESQAAKLGFVQASDWCHARRKFLEAELTTPNEAKPILDDIGELFMVEREIAERSASLDPAAAQELRASIRRDRSTPIVTRIGERAGFIRAYARARSRRRSNISKIGGTACFDF